MLFLVGIGSSFKLHGVRYALITFCAADSLDRADPAAAGAAELSLTGDGYPPLASLTRTPPSWTSKMKCGAAAASQ